MRKLQTGIRVGLRFKVDEDLLDPMNAPAYAQAEQEFIEYAKRWAEDPNLLLAELRRLRDEVREEFVKAKPSLRVRYATVINPIPTAPSTDTEN